MAQHTCTEAHKNASIKYAKNHLKRIPLDVRKEQYDEIKAAAEAKRQSVNGYIKDAIEARMKSEGHYITFKQPRACDIGKYGIIFRYRHPSLHERTGRIETWCKEDDGTLILYKTKDEAQWRADTLEMESDCGSICEYVVREYTKETAGQNQHTEKTM